MNEQVADIIALFLPYEGCMFNSCSAEGLVANVKSPDKLTLTVFKP